MKMIAVSAWIDDYLKRYPQASVDCEYTGRIVDIVHEGFDLAIRIGPLADSSLAARRIGELRYGLFAAPGYLERRGRPRTPADLAGHDLLHFVTGTRKPSWLLRRGAAEQRVAVSPRLRVNNSFAVRDAALHGLGIARIPLAIIEERHAGALQAVLPIKGVRIERSRDKAAWRIEGKVKVAPKSATEDVVSLTWRVLDAKGKEAGTIAQENVVPRGRLKKPWAEVAGFAAEAAAEGIAQLLQQVAQAKGA